MDMLKRYLTETEQRALLQAARRTADELAERDHHWMRLLLETGMRVAEMASLSARQAEQALASGWLVVQPWQRKANGKGERRGHSYLVTEPVRASLQALLRLQRMELHPIERVPEPPLIWGRGGAPLSVRSYQARIAEWAREAGLPHKVSPHWLRHSRGVNIIRRSRADNPMKVAQLALGHATVATTGIYTQISREEFVQALQATAGGRVPRKAAVAAAAQHQAVAP